MNNLQNFSETLKDLIFEKEITAKDLSEDIGCPVSDICHWQRGVYVPSLDNIVKLADYFSVSVDYLVGRMRTNSSCNYKSAENFADRLPILLSENNSNVNKLSNATEISSRTIYDWKYGKSKPQPDSLIKIADTWKVTLDYLIGREK